MMQEHGSFTLKTIEQTLIIMACGAWNIETTLRFVHENKKLTEHINAKPWACLVDLKEWDLSTPEIWPYIDELNIWAAQQGQRFEVVVYNNSIQKQLLVDSHKKLKGVEIEYFKTPEDAYQWLKEKNML